MALKVEVKHGEVTRKDIVFIDPRNVVPSRINGRAFPVPMAEVKKLALDMKANGQQSPIQMSRFADLNPGMFECIFGNTRLAAGMWLIESGEMPDFKLKAEIVRNITPEDALLANIRENAYRNEITPIDAAFNLDVLMNKFGKSAEECAALFGKSTAWVSQTLKINDLGKKARKALQEKILSQAGVWEMFDLTEAEQERVVEEAPKTKDKKNGTEQITVAAVRAAKRDIIAARPEASAATSTGDKAPKPVKLARKPGEIRNFWKAVAETDFYMPEGKGEEVRKFASDYLRWMDGDLKRDSTMFQRICEFGGIDSDNGTFEKIAA